MGGLTSANNDRGRGAVRSQNVNWGRLLGGPAAYEDSYQAGIAYGMSNETTNRYEGTPLERLVSPGTSGNSDSNRAPVTAEQGNRLSIGKHSSSSNKFGSSRTVPTSAKSRAESYTDPFERAGSPDAVERVYRSPW